MIILLLPGLSDLILRKIFYSRARLNIIYLFVASASYLSHTEIINFQSARTLKFAHFREHEARARTIDRTIKFKSLPAIFSSGLQIILPIHFRANCQGASVLSGTTCSHRRFARSRAQHLRKHRGLRNYLRVGFCFDTTLESVAHSPLPLFRSSPPSAVKFLALLRTLLAAFFLFRVAKRPS